MSELQAVMNQINQNQSQNKVNLRWFKQCEMFYQDWIWFRIPLVQIQGEWMIVDLGSLVLHLKDSFIFLEFLLVVLV